MPKMPKKTVHTISEGHYFSRYRNNAFQIPKNLSSNHSGNLSKLGASSSPVGMMEAAPHEQSASPALAWFLIRSGALDK